MSLLVTLKDAMKDAMRAKDKVRLGTIRMALAAIKQREIDDQVTLNDAEITSIIVKMVKQRRDAHDQYHEAGRQDLADIEANEISVLESFLPKPLTEEEILSLIDSAITDCNAAGMQDMGKVMGMASSQLAGQADGKTISGIVKDRLSQ